MRPFKLSLSRLLLCAACVVAPSAAPAAEQGARPRILVEDAASPWSNHDGDGYANDLVRFADKPLFSVTPRFYFNLPPQESFIGFSTAHPDGDARRRSFNAGFHAIGENGARQAIQAEWKLRCAKFCAE